MSESVCLVIQENFNTETKTQRGKAALLKGSLVRTVIHSNTYNQRTAEITKNHTKVHTYGRFQRTK